MHRIQFDWPYRTLMWSPIHVCNLSINISNTNVSPPILTTSSISNILQNSASSGGNISSDGGSSITSKGVCWSTLTNPTINGINYTLDGTGVGTFTSSIINLLPNTKYYVRAYATNIAGTSYGSNLSFTTPSAINLSLDGVWDRTDIEVTFLGTEGKFTEINSGLWLDAKNKGFVAINTVKFRNIVKTGTNTWSGEELWQNSNNGVVTGINWQSATLTMSSDGKTFSVGGTTYVRK